MKATESKWIPPKPATSSAWSKSRRGVCQAIGVEKEEWAGRLFFAGGTGRGFSRRLFREHARKNRIDMANLPLQIKCMRKRLRVKKFRDARVAGNSLAKGGIAFPCSHRVFLHRFVRVVARHAFFHQ